MMAPMRGRATMASYMPLALHQIDVFDRNRAAVAEISDENGETDSGLRRRNSEDDQGVDLAHDVAAEARECDQVDVDREQDQFDRHQNDDDVLAVEKDAENAKRKQNRCNRKVVTKPDRHDSPCPGLTLTSSIALAFPR